MEKTFSGIKDVDKKILEQLDDKDLFHALLTNKYISKVVDENFWKARLINKYPLTAEYKQSDLSWLENHGRISNTWKNYYLYIIYYADKIQREFNFKFVRGNPDMYYYYLSASKYNRLVNTFGTARKLAKQGDEELALYLVNKVAERIEQPLYSLGTPEWESLKNY